MTFDIVVRNGLVVDGTGNPWFRADIGLVDGRIAKIGKIEDSVVALSIDAGGRVVAPGFIDMHTHSDLMVFSDPTLAAKVQQGITTDVLAQDGMSVAPVNNETRGQWRKILAGLNGDPPVDWIWSTLGEYMSALERLQPGINMATLVPYGNIRAHVMGFGSRAATSADLENMKSLVEQGMLEGACGMSLGLIYQPQMYATQAELTEVFSVVGRYHGVMVVHIRNEGDLLLEAIDEVLAICQAAGCALHISHIKVAGKANWYKAPIMLAKLENARGLGQDVTFDQYPYTAGSTFFHAVLPPWATEGGVDKTVSRLHDPDLRRRMASDIDRMVGTDRPTHDPILQYWDNFVGAAGWDGIMISAVGNQDLKGYEGRYVAELASENGQEPSDFAFDLLAASECNVTMVVFFSSEENVARFLAHDFGSIGSDGLLIGRCHPRAYGSFPRTLGRYVREQGLTSLPQMIRRMTSFPAQRLGLQDRGLIREGLKADLVIFDPVTIVDVGTYEDPCQTPIGIQAVLVNGVLALENGVATGARGGQVLRRKY